MEPPASLVEALAPAVPAGAPALRPVPASQWHVTLRFLADADPDAVVSALDGLSWDGGPVEAEAGPRTGPLGGRVWVLPVAGLDRLASAVTAATAGLGPLPGGRFHGHLTLARARRPAALRGLAGVEVGLAWPVEGIAAYRSELGAAGARHHLLGRWPLGAQ